MEEKTLQQILFDYLKELVENGKNLKIKDVFAHQMKVPVEQREPTLTDYQHSEYVVERVIYRDRRHPLPTVLINNFNDKTGSDLGEVQIVYGPGANEYARSRHALALAVLDTIYFLAFRLL